MESTENENRGGSPQDESLSEEVRSLVNDIRVEVHELHDEVQDIREEIQTLRENETQEGSDALLSREEAAEWLGISVRTLDDMANAGEIQPVQIRGRVLYHPETLKAYVKRCAKES